MFDLFGEPIDPKKAIHVNIYSDEMLWLANIHPESNPKKIPNDYKN